MHSIKAPEDSEIPPLECPNSCKSLFYLEPSSLVFFSYGDMETTHFQVTSSILNGGFLRSSSRARFLRYSELCLRNKNSSILLSI